jgi:hypothetical protein
VAVMQTDEILRGDREVFFLSQLDHQTFSQNFEEFQHGACKIEDLRHLELGESQESLSSSGELDLMPPLEDHSDDENIPLAIPIDKELEKIYAEMDLDRAVIKETNKKHFKASTFDFGGRKCSKTNTRKSLLLQLPHELLLHIFSFCNCIGLCRLSFVSRLDISPMLFTLVQRTP